jgi:hypothetical protein
MVNPGVRLIHDPGRASEIAPAPGAEARATRCWRAFEELQEGAFLNAGDNSQ